MSDVTALLTATVTALHASVPPHGRWNKEARLADVALKRLQAAFKLCAGADVALLDKGAVADVTQALQEVREVAARAAAWRTARPRLHPEHTNRRKAWTGVEKRRVEVAANRIDAVVQVALWKRRGHLRGVEGGRTWEFSLIESPITLLKERRWAAVSDGQLVMAMWRGNRVRVRVVRGDRARFWKEGDYLWRLSACASVGAFLGGGWEDGGKTGLGFLVLEVVKGVSLERVVRGGGLDLVGMLRVAHLVVKSLVHLQGVVGGATHQDLVPANVILVPRVEKRPEKVKERESLNSTNVDVEQGVGGVEEGEAIIDEFGSFQKKALKGFFERMIEEETDVGSTVKSEEVEPPALMGRLMAEQREKERKEREQREKKERLEVASYTVKVVDFAPAEEAEGSRGVSTWITNDNMSGYCPPEKATASMWRRAQQAREKERERERERDRRGIIGRASGRTSGRTSPMPGASGRSSPMGRRSGQSSPWRGSRRQSSGVGSGSTTMVGDMETFGLHLDEVVDIAGSDDDSPRPVSPVAGTPGRKTEAFRDMDVRRRDRGDDEGVWFGKRRSMESEGGRLAKIDVWCVGWLVYYMATGKHPPKDVWARRSTELKEMGGIAPETREIIDMCIQRDVNRRACMRDVKRQIDRVLQRLMFERGLALLDTERKAAVVLLDKAVGIRTPRGGEEREELGLTQQTRAALASLPLVIVRRVEWEAAARYLGRSEEEVKRLRRALVRERWTRMDVGDGEAAVKYLEKRGGEGVVAAKSALGWVYRWGAGGVEKNVAKAMELWEEGRVEAEAANGLGLIYHHGREGVGVDGNRARRYYEVGVAEGYPAAAVNLGVLLHDGGGGVGADGVKAKECYERAVEWGDALAANNLGLLYQYGGVGLERDAVAAAGWFRLAVQRGESKHAARNLHELLRAQGEA